MKIMLISTVVLLLGGLLSISLTRNEQFGIIRVKGIVVVDSAGRDRILIGSPVPYSKDRVRTDSSMVRKHFASKFRNPDQYMGWYQKYKNSADGIIVMNEQGFDRVLLGDKLADANVGVRMFESSGILWNDAQGWERGGAGVNTTSDGKSRPVIGLDDESGEAMHMVCLEDGSKGIIIAGENGMMTLVMSKSESEMFQTKKAFAGIKYFDKKGHLVWEQSMMKDSTKIQKKQIKR